MSHDRELIRSFATRLFAFTRDGLVDYKGACDEYLEKCAEKPEKRRR